MVQPWASRPPSGSPRVLASYARLNEDEIKTLVVEDEWFASLDASIESEVQQLTQRLAGRVRLVKPETKGQENFLR